MVVMWMKQMPRRTAGNLAERQARVLSQLRRSRQCVPKRPKVAGERHQPDRHRHHHRLPSGQLCHQRCRRKSTRRSTRSLGRVRVRVHVMRVQQWPKVPPALRFQSHRLRRMTTTRTAMQTKPRRPRSGTASRELLRRHLVSPKHPLKRKPQMVPEMRKQRRTSNRRQGKAPN